MIQFSGAPHSAQNRAPSTAGAAPHTGHIRFWAADFPQPGQNFAPSGRAAPQDGQRGAGSSGASGAFGAKSLMSRGLPRKV